MVMKVCMQLLVIYKEQTYHNKCNHCPDDPANEYVGGVVFVVSEP